MAPALDEVPHAAGLLGSGSDVLGYDTARSTDHDWGPRVNVYVARTAVTEVRDRLGTVIPESFRGWPVRIGRAGGPLEHHITVGTWSGWLFDDLRVDAGAPTESSIGC